MVERVLRRWGWRRHTGSSPPKFRHAGLCCLTGSVTGIGEGSGGGGQGNSGSGSRAGGEEEEEEEEKHPVYRGVRQRSWGKWVSEIREPKKKSRIWLGSFSSPHMAARAYDVAALSLKGPDAQLNFPEARASLPRPASLSSKCIQTAASEYAMQMGSSPGTCSSLSAATAPEQDACGSSSSYVDEDLIFNMHGVLTGMAEAMLLEVRQEQAESEPEDTGDDDPPGLWD